MKLDVYLKKEDIKQSDFAVKIGTTQQAISNYCQGYPPKRSMALKIIKVTKGKVTLEDLWDVKFIGMCPKG